MSAMAMGLKKQTTRVTLVDGHELNFLESFCTWKKPSYSHQNWFIEQSPKPWFFDMFFCDEIYKNPGT